MENLPQVIMTSDKVWDPSRYNTKFSIDDHLKSLPAHPAGVDHTYDDCGEIDIQTSRI